MKKLVLHGRNQHTILNDQICNSVGKKKKIKPFTILRLIGIVLFVYILSINDLGEIYNALVNTDVILFLIGLAFAVLVLLFKTMRWIIMRNDADSGKSWQLVAGQFLESYAIGIVTPGRVGELMKAGHEVTRDNKINILIKAISERGIDIGVFILLAGMAMVFGKFIDVEFYISIPVIIFSICITLVSILLLSSDKILNKIEDFINWLPFIKQQVTLNIKHYNTRSTFLIILYSLLSNFAYFISCYYLAHSVNLAIDFASVSGGVALSGLLTMLPITVMGMGTREFVFIEMFNTYPESIILAFSATMLIVAQLGGGLISMISGQILLKTGKSKNLSNGK